MEKITKYFDIYTKQIHNNRNKLQQVLLELYELLQNIKYNNLYFTGIGKCSHICHKSISTWNSVGLSCYLFNIPDAFHGDFGLLKDYDLIIYISNSGNTEEILKCANYINSKFPTIVQIALTMNQNNKLQNYVNYHFQITNEGITEIDDINMAPTVSSVIFMMLLDSLGVYIAENNNLTKEKFQLNHPGGSLGKR